jgi:hypothetical protein
VGRHAAWVIRTRAMCLAGRATAVAAGAPEAALCTTAPLWVVVHVCKLLREY